MGFQGVVCSDSLLMAGVRDQFEREEEMALAVLNAGVDLLLDLREPVKVDRLFVRLRRLAASDDGARGRGIWAIVEAQAADVCEGDDQLDRE